MVHPARSTVLPPPLYSSIYSASSSAPFGLGRISLKMIINKGTSSAAGSVEGSSSRDISSVLWDDGIKRVLRARGEERIKSVPFSFVSAKSHVPFARIIPSVLVGGGAGEAPS